MTFPVVADSATDGSSAGVSPHVVTIPPRNADDVIIVYYASFAGDGSPPSDLGGESWAPLASEGGGASSVWWLRAANSTGSTVTFTPSFSTQYAAAAVRVTGASTSADIEIASAESTDDPPALNPTGWGVEDTLWLAGYSDVQNGVNATPANYTPVATTNPFDVVAVAERDNAVASEDPGSWSADFSGFGLATTIAVPPTTVTVKQLSADLTGQGTLTAPLAVIRQLSASLTGSGTLTASLLTPEWVRFHLGVFAAVMPPYEYEGYRDADGAMVWRPLELVDRSHFWRSDSTADPVTVTSGTNIAQYVRDDLAVRFHEMDTDGVEDNGVTAARDYVFDGGTPWLDIYNTLLGAAGQEPLHADVDGKPVSVALVDPETRSSEHSYTSGTTIVPKVKIEAVNPELPNVLRFVGKRWGGKTTEGDGIRTVVNETTGPGSRRQRGGKTVLLRVEVDAQTQADLDAQARALAPFYFGGGGLRYVGQVGLNPRHDDSDVVQITRDALGITGTWLVTGWTVNLGTVDAMRVMDLELEILTGAAFLSQTPIPSGAYGTQPYGARSTYGGLVVP